MVEFEFDKHTAVQLVKGDPATDKDLEFKAQISSAYNIGGAPNGGYLTSLCIAALQKSVQHPHPCVVTTCKTESAVQILVSKIRITKRQSIAQARIVQDGSERIRVTANFTEFDKSNTKTTVRRQFPGNPIEKCIKVQMDPILLPNFSRAETIMEEGSSKVWNTKDRDNSGVVASYLRFSDGREIDMKGLVYFADFLYPTPFKKDIQELGMLAGTWIPTLELTVQLFAEPAPGYVYVYNKCTEVVNGIVGIEGSMWDSNKNLVGITRQTALISSMQIRNNKLRSTKLAAKTLNWKKKNIATGLKTLSRRKEKKKLDQRKQGLVLFHIRGILIFLFFLIIISISISYVQSK